jgi:hypothetical protein
MNLNDKTTKQNTGLIRSLFGGLLIGLPFIPDTAFAAPSSVLNPCPRIFYEEPHNNQVVVPQGCPPNAYTQRLGLGGEAGVVVQPRILVRPEGLPLNRRPIPYPESRQNPIATITPAIGKVSVRLKNDTNTYITYQAIGHTETRILPGGQEYLLENLPTPVTITLVREDDGLLQVLPVSSSEGTLVVTLDETTNFDDNQGVLRIQEDGQVFLN